MKIKNWFTDFFKGTALGTGILPGVSVGTVGLIVKVYEKLIGAINGLRKNFVKSFFTLLPIALGCIITAVILLVVQDTAYSIIPFELTCIFAGFVLGGIPVVYNDLKEEKFHRQDNLQIIFGFIIAAGIGVLSVVSKIYWKLDLSEAFETPDANWWIYPLTFVVGFVAAVGCLLPGISGAMILFIFGLYQPVVGLFKGDNSMIHNPDRLPTGLILTSALLLGVIIGLLAVSKLMSTLLEKRKRETYTMILGFITGSFVSMFINQEVWDIYSSLEIVHWVFGIVCLIISTVFFFILVVKFACKTTPSKMVSKK